MPRKKKEKEILRDVLIEKAAAEGKAIGRADGMIIFVPLAIPGDIADILVTKKRDKYMEGRIVRIVRPSPDRTEPFCSHYGECGGCKWQPLPYPMQLEFKQKQVCEQLAKIGHTDMDKVVVLPILPSPETTEYRNKLEFAFSDRRWIRAGEDPGEIFDPPTPLDPADFEGGVFPHNLRKGYSTVNSNPKGFALGFHTPGAFDKILDIRECKLQPRPSNEIRNFMREYAIQHSLPFFNIREQTGFLRNIIIRNNLKGDVMLTVMFGARPPKMGRLKSPFRPEDCESEAERLFDALMERFPEIKSLNYTYNGKLNDSMNDLDVINARGEDAIYEEMDGLRFKIGPKSFYQTNPRQAQRLYSVVREFAGLSGSETVYDLYTGTGTIALYVADSTGKVIGIEYVPEAIHDAGVNASINGIDNCSFYAGDMKDILTPEFIASHGASPDVIILDPPRAGVHPDVIKVLLGAGARRIVYVSCNPATQARDIAMLAEKYRLVKIRPVDMFPHTHHVENVALLELKDSE